MTNQNIERPRVPQLEMAVEAARQHLTLLKRHLRAARDAEVYEALPPVSLIELSASNKEETLADLRQKTAAITARFTGGTLDA